MNKIKELFNRPLPWVLIVAFLTLTAQIGYVRVRGTGTAGTQACWSSINTIDSCGASESIDGAGTATKIPKFSDANTLTDSVIAETAGTITIASGGLVVTTGTVSIQNGALQIVGGDLTVTNALTDTSDLTVQDDAQINDVLIVSGNVTLGSNDADNITINGPTKLKVKREDFDSLTYAKMQNESGDSPSVTDASINQLWIHNGQIPIIGYRWEQAYGGTANFINDGYYVPDLDDAENDGFTAVFGTPRFNGVQVPDGGWDEDNNESVYCEISLLITDVSEVDILWFGWPTADASLPIDAGLWADVNTYAFFVLSDASGDLDIVTSLNNGTDNNDDTGITWADTNEKVLRVVANADTVTFWVDGAQITQTNAVLNFDDGDISWCEFGYVNAAGDATPAPGIKIGYVEIGIYQ